MASELAAVKCTSSRCARSGRITEVPWVCRCGARFCNEACWIQSWHAGHQRHCPHAAALLEEASSAKSRRRGAALLAGLALARKLSPDGGAPASGAGAQPGAAACPRAGEIASASPSMQASVSTAASGPSASAQTGGPPAAEVPAPPPPPEERAAADELHAGGSDEVHAADERTGYCGPHSPRYALQDFDHICELGSGACGRVTKVAKKDTGEIFALKAIEKGRVAQHRLQDHVKREVATQRTLDHPNVVRLHDCFEDQSCIYLLLEYAPDGHLFSRIQRSGRLHDLEAAAVFVDISRALIDLHERGVAHRDIKPENVLLFPGSRAKLADFGWCAELKAAGRLTFCGTMDYLSPEMISLRPHDHRVDVWAMGVLLFEMLVGAPPFHAKGAEQSVQRILAADLRLPEHLSVAAGDLIQSLLRKEPSRRVPLREALSHRWLEDAARSAHPAPALQPAPTRRASPRTLPTRADGPAELAPAGVPSEDLPLAAPSEVRERVDVEAAELDAPPSPERAREASEAGRRAGSQLRPVPKIAGFTSLESFAGRPAGSATQRGGHLDACLSPAVDASMRDSAASFFGFGEALRPCGRAWTQSPPSDSKCGSKDFMLDTCLEPVSEILSARGSWSSAARPVEASATPWFAPVADPVPTSMRLPHKAVRPEPAGFAAAGERSVAPPAEIPRLARLDRARQVCQAGAGSAASTARSGETPQTWRETHTYSQVRSWVRGEVTRQVLARELDRTIGKGSEGGGPSDAASGGGTASQGFCPAEARFRGASKAWSTSTDTPVSVSSGSNSFVSESEFSARGMAELDTPTSTGEDHRPGLPVLLARMANVKPRFPDFTPTFAKR